MQTAVGQTLYPLPSDFGRIVRLIIDERETCGAFRSIWVITAEDMDRLHSDKEGAVGAPATAAVVWDGADRYLRFHPDPDAQYNIEAVYEPHLKTL